MADNVSATGNRNTPKEIWNEGRVVGYSAYEIYVKQHLAEAPDIPVASEREWLASTLTSGSSLLLKVPAVMAADEDSFNYIDIPLPATSILCAANTIVANFFDGEAFYPTYWATKVTDYGSCISNTSSSHPEENVNTPQTAVKNPEDTDVPYQPVVPVNTELTSWPSDKVIALRNYMKIVDGVVIQPGKYENTESGSPQVELTEPNHNSAPFIRLLVKGAIDETHRPQILLTGFTISTVLYGTLGEDTSTDTNAPQNGDFLGPAVLPWANKIVFSVPNQYIAFFASGNYKRQLRYEPGTDPKKYRASTDQIVHSEPLIDLEQPAYCELVVDEATSSINLSSEYDDTYEPIAVYTCAYSPSSLEFVAHWRLVPSDPYWTVVFTSPVAAGTKLRVMMKRTSLDNYGWISQTTDKYLFNKPDDASMDTDKTGQQIRFKDRKESYFRDTTITVYYNVPLVDSASVLTVFQKKTVYPPALYATLVTKSTGTESMFPVDIVSPGSVKLFNVQDESDAKGIIEDYQKTFTGTTAIVKDPMSGVFKAVSGHRQQSGTIDTAVYPIAKSDASDFAQGYAGLDSDDDIDIIDPDEDEEYELGNQSLAESHPVMLVKSQSGKDSILSLPAGRHYYTGTGTPGYDQRTASTGELTPEEFVFSSNKSDILDVVTICKAKRTTNTWKVSRQISFENIAKLVYRYNGQDNDIAKSDILSFNEYTGFLVLKSSVTVPNSVTSLTVHLNQSEYAPPYRLKDVVSEDYITWTDLLRALAGNKKLDILGQTLRDMRTPIKLALSPKLVNPGNHLGGVLRKANSSHTYLTVDGADSPDMYGRDMRITISGSNVFWEGSDPSAADDSSSFVGTASVSVARTESSTGTIPDQPDYLLSDELTLSNALSSPYEHSHTLVARKPYRILQLFGIGPTDNANVLNLLKLIKAAAPHKYGGSYLQSTSYNEIQFKGSASSLGSDDLSWGSGMMGGIVRIDIGSICSSFDAGQQSKKWWLLDLNALDPYENIRLLTASGTALPSSPTWKNFCIPAVFIITTTADRGFFEYPGGQVFTSGIQFSSRGPNQYILGSDSTSIHVPSGAPWYGSSYFDSRYSIASQYTARGKIQISQSGDFSTDVITITL